jgi:hypothetical protein
MTLAPLGVNGAHMDASTAQESLLDEADFLAELATLEDGMTTRRRSPLALEDHAYEAVSREPAFEPLTLSEEREGAPSLLQQVAAAAMFVLMMGVGAAGAALVFHAQVARILVLW